LDRAKLEELVASTLEDDLKEDEKETEEESEVEEEVSEVEEEVQEPVKKKRGRPRTTTESNTRIKKESKSEERKAFTPNPRAFEERRKEQKVKCYRLLIGGLTNSVRIKLTDDEKSPEIKLRPNTPTDWLSHAEYEFLRDKLRNDIEIIEEDYKSIEDVDRDALRIAQAQKNRKKIRDLIDGVKTGGNKRRRGFIIGKNDADAYEALNAADDDDAERIILASNNPKDLKKVARELEEQGKSGRKLAKKAHNRLQELIKK